MATENKPQAAGNSVPLTINAQYIKDLSFENPKAPASLLSVKEQPGINVNVDVQAQKLQDSTYEVVLKVNAEASGKGEPVFIIELLYAGIFTIGDIEPKYLEPLLLVECPRLLFPFARSVISNLSREGGYPPLMIQPIDFAMLYRQQRMEMQQQEDTVAQA